MKNSFLTLTMMGFIGAFGSIVNGQEKITGEDLIDQWVKTERLVVTERLDWEKRKVDSQQLMKLYQAELILLNEELDKTGKHATLFDENSESLKQSIKDSEAARLLAIHYLTQLKPKMLVLVMKFPNILQDQLNEQTFTLQNEVNNATVQDALRAMTKILQEAARFNRNYVFEEQSIELEGEMLRAKVMYLGLSCAFFQAGEKFGTAEPTKEGWVFKLNPNISKEVKKAFAIENKSVPSSFFKLPLRLNAKSL